MKAKKLDNNKPRLSIIPFKCLMGVIKVFEHGAKKYAPHNYRLGMDRTRYADACFRHLHSWLIGNDMDKESGLPHLDHAIASLMMLRENEIEGRGKDDRVDKTIQR